MMEESKPAERAPRRHGARLPALLLEAALIVLSVLLGFAVNAWQSKRADEALIRNVQRNFRSEVQANLAALQRAQPRHAELARQLATAAERTHPDSAAFDVFSAALAGGGTELAPLQEAAWQTAGATGALRLLDYRTASALSETYLIQHVLMQTEDRLSERFFSPDNFEPGSQRAMLRTLSLIMNEFSGQEQFLMQLYRTTLRTLPPSDSAAAH